MLRWHNHILVAVSDTFSGGHLGNLIRLNVLFVPFTLLFIVNMTHFWRVFLLGLTYLTTFLLRHCIFFCWHFSLCWQMIVWYSSRHMRWMFRIFFKKWLFWHVLFGNVDDKIRLILRRQIYSTFQYFQVRLLTLLFIFVKLVLLLWI